VFAKMRLPAEPKRKVARSKSRMLGNMIVPKWSICFAGLRLTRPSRHARSSTKKMRDEPGQRYLHDTGKSLFA
jgi:hypothetical protein